MNRENDPEAELRRIARMLEKTAAMAEHATLTGSMSGGREYAVRSYNATLKHLEGLGEVPPSLFPPLPDDASLDEVGIASAQLAEYLRAGFTATPREIVGDGNIMINLGPLGDIAQMVRENLPEWLRGGAEARPGRRGEEETGGHHRAQRGGPGEEGTASAAASTGQAAGFEELRRGGATPRPEPRPTADRKREILEALREGRITADEAIEQLREL